MGEPSAFADPPAPPPPEPSTPLEPVPIEPTPPPERSGRAGRNLRSAITVGVALAAVVIASLAVVQAAFVALAVGAVVLALWELRNAFAARDIRLPLVPAVTGGAAMVVAAYVSGPEALVVALALTSVATLAWRAADGPDDFVRDATSGVFAAAYVPFLAGFAMLLLRGEDGPLKVLVFILLTVCSDVGGYVAGVLAGRHPLAPRVSPKKSWEGLAGSAGAAAAVGALALPLLLHRPAWAGALLGLVVAVVATLGDLGESMMKRDLGIKDMGALLPGHGGVMDRLDSLLPTAAAVWLLLEALPRAT